MPLCPDCPALLPCAHVTFHPKTPPNTHLLVLPLSLLVLSEHVILFALHVLKVELGPCHALVDVLDVIAGSFKVRGGIICSRAEDLQKECSQKHQPRNPEDHK